MDEDTPPLNPPSTTPSPQSSIPEQQAAQSIMECNRPFNADISVDQMLVELHEAFTSDGDCEQLLFMQSRVLDALFARLISRAMTGVDENGDPVIDYIDSQNINLALRAQKVDLLA